MHGWLEVAQGLAGLGGGRSGLLADGDGAERRDDTVAGGALERAADDLAGAEADGEREGEDDAAEEDAEGELDDVAADSEVVEHHGGGQDQDHPLDPEREHAGVAELGV